MTFGLWNKKSTRGEGKPSVAAVVKRKWSSLKGKLSRRDQQVPDTRLHKNTPDSSKVITTERPLQYPRGESKPSVATVAKGEWPSLKGKQPPRRVQQLPDTQTLQNAQHSINDRPRDAPSGPSSSFAATALPTRAVHPRYDLAAKTEVDQPRSPRPLPPESRPVWNQEFYTSTMAAERRVAAERVNPALTTKIKEFACAEVGNIVLPPLSPSMRRRTGPVVDGTRTTSACPPVSPRAPDLHDVSSKLLGGLPKEVRSGHLGQRQSPTRPSGTVSSIPSGRAIHRAADEANSIPTMRIEEPTPQSMRVKSYHYVYRPPTPPRASEFSIGVREGEEPGPASIRAEAPVVVLPPRYPSSCRKSSNAVTAPAHRPGHRRTNPQAVNVSPRPLVGRIEETHLQELRSAPSSGLRTIRSSPLKRDDLEVSVSLPVTQTPVHLARRNDQPDDGADGSERSESGDSDDSDKTIRPSRIRFPSQSGDSGDSDRTPRASMILVPSGPRSSDQSGQTSRASRVGVPSGFAAAAVQQAIQSGHAPARDIGRNGKTSSSPSTERTHPPTAFLRGPQQPQLGLRDRTPQVAETEIRGREPQVRPNIPTSRQIGLSTRDIWARQLEYQLEVCASTGDDRTYAAATRQALGAGFVICPNHVLRRASALIPKHAAFLPNNGASL